jgi:hypothetical protein
MAYLAARQAPPGAWNLAPGGLSGAKGAFLVRPGETPLKQLAGTCAHTRNHVPATWFLVQQLHCCTCAHTRNHVPATWFLYADSSDSRFSSCCVHPDPEAMLGSHTCFPVTQKQRHCLCLCLAVHTRQQDKEISDTHFQLSEYILQTGSCYHIDHLYRRHGIRVRYADS